MLRHVSGIFAAAAFTASATAFAQTTVQPAEQPIEVKAKKVCKSEAVVGSRLGGKRICRTPAEWAAIELRERQAAESYQRDPCRSGAGSTGGAIQC